MVFQSRVMQDMTITFEGFLNVDIRAGTGILAKPCPKARKPEIELWVDFGDEIGEKKEFGANYRVIRSRRVGW